MEIYRDPRSSLFQHLPGQHRSPGDGRLQGPGHGENWGPLAALPIIEGKSVIFKDVFRSGTPSPVCLNTQNVDEIVQAVTNLGPTFGAICMEDISSLPAASTVEWQLKRAMNIPVMHNDQHAGSILALACLINALKITGKEKESLKVVINGAGAGGIATARFLLEWGCKGYRRMRFQRGRSTNTDPTG